MIYASIAIGPEDFFIECSVHEVWSSILCGGTQDFFFPFYTSNQNSVCTLGCLKPVEKKSFNFFQNGYELFPHVFTPSKIFFNIPRVG